MPATLTQVVKQFRQDWTAQLEADAILKVCHDVGYAWRERCLDPVTTTQFFFVQVVHGNTACAHLRHLTKINVTASAYCQARTRLPLEVFTRLLRAVGDGLQHEPRDERSWLATEPFLSTDRVSPCPIPLSFKSILANLAANSPVVGSR